MSDCHGCANCAVAEPPPSLQKSARPHVVAIIGPPNSGKSTLFNRLTGLRQKVANFPGVTVEQRVGKARMQHKDRDVVLVDLPGVYSLNPRSEDEQVTRDVLAGTMPGIPKPDALLLILDCTNLGRHLVLAAPILSLKLPTLVILNMADDLKSRGGEVDTAELATELGAPVALISASKGQGVEKVFQFMEGTSAGTTSLAPPRVELPVLQDIPALPQVGARRRRRRGLSCSRTTPMDATSGCGLLASRRRAADLPGRRRGSFPNHLRGRETFDGRPAELDSNFGGQWIGNVLPAGIFRSLLVEGVVDGVGSVVVFLPQILLLFLFIGILEDSGYLARAALIADRTMAKFGLQGKSFIPLLSAYACAVPAIMATRTIESKRDRLATILIAPFMTCSARLPVYTLIIAAFIPERPLLGPLLRNASRGAARPLRAGLCRRHRAPRASAEVVHPEKRARTPFVLEMPPYRWPTLRSLGLRLIDRSKVFLRRAGTVILAGHRGALGPRSICRSRTASRPRSHDSFAGMIGHAVEPAIKPLGFNWKIGIGLISSIAAREVIVGTLGTIYGMRRHDGIRWACSKPCRAT